MRETRGNRGSSVTGVTVSLFSVLSVCHLLPAAVPSSALLSSALLCSALLSFTAREQGQIVRSGGRHSNMPPPFLCHSFRPRRNRAEPGALQGLGIRRLLRNDEQTTGQGCGGRGSGVGVIRGGSLFLTKAAINVRGPPLLPQTFGAAAASARCSCRRRRRRRCRRARCLGIARVDSDQELVVRGNCQRKGTAVVVAG